MHLRNERPTFDLDSHECNATIAKQLHLLRRNNTNVLKNPTQTGRDRAASGNQTALEYNFIDLRKKE